MSNEKKPLANEEETAADIEETPTGKQSDENAEKTTVSLKEESEGAENSQEDEINEEGKDEVSMLKDELEAEQNKYLRLLADYDNFKRRTQKDREISAKFRSQSLLTDLLPVLDNFERALAVEAKSEDAVSIMKGVEMVQKSLLEAVKREGLEEIKAVGEPFDPNFHQAVMQEKDEDAEPGTVLQELQKGYTLKGRVLRPAMVKVNE
ncbi:MULTISPECIES: nucleotide exchange factor GrpE [Planococcaceae]|uniref:Protein GrpE n=1 Tax=Planococcus halotolerans TaxID=2233542 RepID=A0A365KTX4_9BACL|nr:MULTISPECIES: nucleotide exchange factor GrpE [Planococcaceae]QHJ71517.1 nucleotide exchange factor GrpE [Planococcus halotolerans]RAZ76629.1 nucleotide exchange factor GrpE [Planococcus halotolerans]RLQ92057.1 nucleotide exchange factor GrpE [Planomicrobium sp. Y74]